MDFVFSSTVHGLQGRVDSLEKSNSKLIEEVRQSSKNEKMDISFLDIISIYISLKSPLKYKKYKFPQLIPLKSIINL